MLSKMIVQNITRAALQRSAAAISRRNYVSSAECQPNNNNGLEQSYQSYFTHNPYEGYIRNSPFDVVTTPNIALDQYVWQNLSKWPNHVATVSGAIKS